MTQVVVTGARGFIGKNLMVRLSTMPDIQAYGHDLGDDETAFFQALDMADAVFHLAGINRPKDVQEFEDGNYLFTKKILDHLEQGQRNPTIVITSSIQAELDNPYGISKRKAEEALAAYRDRQGATVGVFRLTNVFGKWSRPFYNSVVATFCHQISRDEAVRIDDPSRVIDFVYIDDVIDGLLDFALVAANRPQGLLSISPNYSISVGELAARLSSFREMRKTAVVPDLADPFNRALYSTYLSYLDGTDFAYAVDKKTDNRGYLFELIKTKGGGQIFVSRTLPGITRGNHYHHTKVEKFCVIDGQARISFRHMVSGERIDYVIEGSECRVVDIPPGYTHSITNTGRGDLITLFWANEIFDPQRPDTYFCEV